MSGEGNKASAVAAPVAQPLLRLKGMSLFYQDTAAKLELLCPSTWIKWSDVLPEVARAASVKPESKCTLTRPFHGQVT